MLSPRRVHRLAGAEFRAVLAHPGTAAPAAPEYARGRRHGSIRYAGDARSLFLGVLRAIDVAIVGATATAAYAAWQGSWSLPNRYVWSIAIGDILAVNAFQCLQVYSFASLHRWSAHLVRLAGGWAAALLSVIAVIYFLHIGDDISRGWMALWAASGLGGLLMTRFAARSLIRRGQRTGRLVMSIAIVGSGAVARRVAAHIKESGKGDVRILGVFEAIGGVQRSGSRTAIGLEDLAQLARHQPIDEIVVALPLGAEHHFAPIVQKLALIPADVKLWVDIGPTEQLQRLSMRQPIVRILERPLAGWKMVLKRSTDIAISATMLILLFPLMAMIAALIKLDSKGPVLFRQQRYGFNGEVIDILKFRSMYHAEVADPTAPQARRYDPRVTRLGRFLRRASLDELPQLVNVLTGDMSLVGPRPHPVNLDKKYAALIDGYLARHRVRPGITGWAQISGYRGETDTIEKMEGRIERDLFYINSWSPLLDFRILFTTALVVFRDSKAY